MRGAVHLQCVSVARGAVHRHAAHMPDLVDHPAAWRGEELFHRPDWSPELNAVEIEELRELAAGFAGDETGGFTFQGTPLEAVDTARLALPAVTVRMEQIRHDLEHGSGAVLLRGFPRQDFNDAQCRGLFFAMASRVGTPVSQSATGEKLFSVRDAGFKDDDPRSRGPNTRKKLSFHTDRCDVIGFLCLNAAKSGGENEVVGSVALYHEIQSRRPDLLEVLEQPFCYQRHTVDQGNERPWIEQPVFSIHEGHFACNFLRVLIDRAHRDPALPDLSAKQIEALDFLESVAAEPGLHVRFAQRPGDILFLNNWVTLHRRTEFEDHVEPEKRRHLLRVWLSVPNSRPLAPAFKANYGAVEAGALRGGMKAAG